MRLSILTTTAILCFHAPSSAAAPTAQRPAKDLTTTNPELDNFQGCRTFKLATTKEPQPSRGYAINLPYGGNGPTGADSCAVEFGSSLLAQCPEMTFHGLSCTTVANGLGSLLAPLLPGRRASVQFYVQEVQEDPTCVRNAIRIMFGHDVSCA